METSSFSPLHTTESKHSIKKSKVQKKSLLSSYSNLEKTMSKNRKNHRIKMPEITFDFNNSIMNQTNTQKSLSSLNFNLMKPTNKNEENLNIILESNRDKRQEREKEENVVKRLELWEYENNPASAGDIKIFPTVKKVNKRRPTLSSICVNISQMNPMSKLMQNSDMRSMTEKHKIKDSISKISTKFVTTHLKEFYDKTEQEQGAILLQNINLTKKKFNFDVFKIANNMFKNDDWVDGRKFRPQDGKMDYMNETLKDEINKLKNKEKKVVRGVLVQVADNCLELHKVASERDGRRDKHVKKPQTPLPIELNSNGDTSVKTNSKKYSNYFVKSKLKINQKPKREPSPEQIDNPNPNDEVIKVDDPYLRCNNLKLQGNYEKLISTDYYRSVITTRMKIELLFRKELSKVGKAMLELRKEKKKLINHTADLLGELNKVKENILLKEESIDYLKRAYETKFNLDKKSGTQRLNLTDQSGKGYNMLEMMKKYFTKISLLEKEAEEMKTEFNSAHKNVSSTIKSNNTEVQRIEISIKKHKIAYENLVKEQTDYYLDLLKKGIDVRREGLSWIVRRLLELNAVLDNTEFPRFLSYHHIEFIVEVSKKQIEFAQLTIISKYIKNNRNKRKEPQEFKELRQDDEYKENKEEDKMLLTTNSNAFTTSKPGVKFHNTTNNFFYSSNLNFSKSHKKLYNMERDFNTRNSIFKLTNEYKTEEMKTDHIIKALKLKLKGVVMDFEEELFINNLISDDFEQTTNTFNYNHESPLNEKRENEFYDFIWKLRENSKRLDQEIKTLKEDQKAKFTRTYQHLKTGSARESIQYDLIYSALFGNHVVI